jgi:hypothetical protein
MAVLEEIWWMAQLLYKRGTNERKGGMWTRRIENQYSLNQKTTNIRYELLYQESRMKLPRFKAPPDETFVSGVKINKRKMEIRTSKFQLHSLEWNICPSNVVRLYPIISSHGAAPPPSPPSISHPFKLSKVTTISCSHFGLLPNETCSKNKQAAGTGKSDRHQRVVNPRKDASRLHVTVGGLTCFLWDIC